MNNSPLVRFHGYSNSWENRKLKEHSQLITKGTTPKNKSIKGDINYIKVENLREGKILVSSKVSENEHLSFLKRSILHEGDVLFSIAGTLGRAAIVEKSILPANTNQALAIIRGYDFNSNFLLTALSGKVVREYVQKNPTVGAQPNLSLEQVGNLIVSSPSVEEQNKIGSFFKKLNDTIIIHQQELDALKKTKQGFLQKMFPKDGKSIPEIRFLNFKECWSKEKLGKVAPLRGGYAFKSNLFCEKGIPIIRISNIKSNGNIDGEFAYIQENPIYETYLLKNNSTLIAMSGATTGKVATIRDLKSKIYQNQRVGYFTKTDRINYEFLSTIVKSTFFKSKLKEILVAGAQPNISSKDIDNLEFFIPTNLEEQVRIGEFFRQLDEIIELKEKELEALKETKKGFLQKMFV